MRAFLLLFLLLLGGQPLANDSPFNPVFAPWDRVGAGETDRVENSHSPLPASQAFLTHARVDERGSVHVSFTSRPGYYIYLDSIFLEGGGFALEGLDKPAGEQVEDETFGTTQVIRGTATVSSQMTTRWTEEGRLHVHFQGCLEKSVCYLPESRAIPLTLPETIPFASDSAEGGQQGAAHAGHSHPMAEDQRLAFLLGERHPLVSLAIFGGLGILLGLTPCVLPMVPVVLGMVAGAQAGGRRTAALAGAYVASHAVVFAILGLGAAWVGANLMASFQGAWAIIPLAVVMAGMGVALLMGVRIQMPGFIQAWAGSKGQGGSIPGAMAMGGLSSLIIGPCVAPPLAAVVFYLAHEGNPWLGAAAFFALGLGMGVPMMAAALGFRNVLTRARGMGQWLIVAMGICLVAAGAWLATRVAPVSIVAGVVAVLMVGIAAYSAAQGRPGPSGSWTGIPRQAWGYGLGACLALSLALVPSSDPAPSAFDRLVAAQDLPRVLEQAESKGETVVVDFHADWCTSCLEMERTTLSADRVREQMGRNGLVPVKIDVTHNSPADRELLQSLGLVGPPAILFFQNGKEARHLRLVGTESEEPFLDRLESAQCLHGAEMAQALATC